MIMEPLMLTMTGTQYIKGFVQNYCNLLFKKR